MKHGPGLRSDAAEGIKSSYRRSGKLMPAAFYAKLHRAARFSRDVTKPDGSTAQIGDNDSGRFLRLGGWVVEGSVAECRARYQNLEGFADLPDPSPYVMQPAQNHQQWLAWESALSGDATLLDESRPAVRANVLALAKALVVSPIAPYAAGGKPDGSAPGKLDPDEYVEDFARAASHRLSSTYRHEGGGLFDGAMRCSYPDFGVYVIRSRRHYLLIRCGDARHDGAGVHAHEDQLAIELAIEGGPVASDPGTYVYTPSTLLRNTYRSALAHVAPSTSRDSGGGSEDEERRPPFAPPAQGRGQCVAFTERCFVGRATTGGGEVVRRVSFDANGVRIDDYYRLEPSWRPASSDLFRPAKPIAHSPAYGVRIAS
jgi:hypothetical protein